MFEIGLFKGRGCPVETYLSPSEFIWYLSEESTFIEIMTIFIC